MNMLTLIQGGGQSTIFWWVGMSDPKYRKGGLKNWFLAKVGFKKLKFLNILGGLWTEIWAKYGLQSSKILGTFWQISHVWVKTCSKWGSKELNHAATGDLKNGGRGVKRGVLTARYTCATFWGKCPTPETETFSVQDQTSLPRLRPRGPRPRPKTRPEERSWDWSWGQDPRPPTLTGTIQMFQYYPIVLL